MLVRATLCLADFHGTARVDIGFINDDGTMSACLVLHKACERVVAAPDSQDFNLGLALNLARITGRLCAEAPRRLQLMPILLGLCPQRHTLRDINRVVGIVVGHS